MQSSPQEADFLRPFRNQRRKPVDPIHQLVYADWLEDQGDRRCQALRLLLVLRFTSLDNPERQPRAAAYSAARAAVEDADWLSIVDPLPKRNPEYPQQSCRCIRGPRPNGQPPFIPSLHTEWQDTTSPGWMRLNQLIDEAITDRRRSFSPLNEMSIEERADVITLPPKIAQLTSVEDMLLYGSNLVSIPPEIAGMTALRKFTPYTSYRLHWFPYEVTRCTKLRDSAISTRALFGNYKSRPMFPLLKPILTGVRDEVLESLAGIPGWNLTPLRNCSVCDKVFPDRQQHRVWISLGIGTDVVPLLVNACSQDCIQNLPKPPDGYVDGPHRGGPNVQQPAPGW